MNVGAMERAVIRTQERLRNRLHGDWPTWAEGQLTCPICGATVHPEAKPLHTQWHELCDPTFDLSPR